MTEIKVQIRNPDNQIIGYFVNPKVETFPESEYEIMGRFCDENGEPIAKLEFNPQSLAYTADLSEVKGLKHKQLRNVYVQRGRQPVRMSGVGIA